MRKQYYRWLMRQSKTRSRQGLYSFIRREFNRIEPSSAVLTIGAGGDVNRLLNKISNVRNFIVQSFDIDSARNPDIVGDICMHDFKEMRYDVVVICEVLEHVHSPHLAIDNIYKILNDSGRLILTTPFVLPLHERPYDYFRYTRYGLAHLLRAFKDVTINERNSYFEAIDVLWLRLLQEQSAKAVRASYILIPIIYYLKRPITRLLSRLIKTDGITTGYVVTAHK